MIDKVRAPATAAGIALIGIAGGVAIVRSRKGSGSGVLPGGRGPKLHLPTPKAAVETAQAKLKDVDIPRPNGSTIDWVEEKARNLGDAGYRIAELASDARKIQKAAVGE